MSKDLKCKQVCALLSYYIQGKTNYQLTNFIEHHLRTCKSCRNKYETLKKAFEDLSQAKIQIDNMQSENVLPKSIKTEAFVEKMSAYLDNELSDEDILRFKKYAIANQSVRNELESMYKVKNIMNTSFEKTRNNLKEDFTKDIILQLDMQRVMSIQEPILKIASIFIFLFVFVTVWAIVLF